MRKTISGLLAATSLLTAAPAFAQGVDEFGAYGGMERAGRVRSPQEAAFEIRVGPYKPHVDDSLPGDPYKTTFGNDTRWHAGIEADWQLLRLKNTLSFGPGIGVAYTHSSAKAPLASGNGLSAQDTTLGIVPFHLVGEGVEAKHAD